MFSGKQRTVCGEQNAWPVQNEHVGEPDEQLASSVSQSYHRKARSEKHLQKDKKQWYKWYSVCGGKMVDSMPRGTPNITLILEIPKCVRLSDLS